MSILVTGGAGYIGSHTCVELIDSKYEIIIVDDFSNSNPISVRRIKELTKKRFSFYNINILNRKELEKVFSENSIEAVIHFAGFKAVEESVQFPLKYYYNNVSGAVILCETMEKFGVKKLVFSSSATVYGTTKSVPTNEEQPLSATNPYGRTKLMIEQILNDLYISDTQWSIALLRYFNPIGAHESGRIGENPNGTPNNLMPYITQVALGKRKMLNIFGNDYETHDGTGVRDYIHVVDLAKGHIKALEKIKNSRGIHVYNLGTGIGYSVLDVIKNFKKVTGREVPYIFSNRRPGDIDKSFADPSKAKKDLGWTAIKGIEEMCRDAWRWQINNPNGYEI